MEFSQLVDEVQSADYILSPERILLLRETLANPYIEAD